ncbi:MAG: UDP-3-O-(3-hydroxymyristoyl)glucosamine N-acyltransferase [Gammaproteobacteria bacterium]|nr:UDP-3-O-(3-hydroxymyristoyl)glucosamine N-acyltransferase [Gammaproteobacteria bacterium]
MAVRLGELAVRFGLELNGDPDTTVDRVGSLVGAGPGCLSFLANPKYRRQLEATAASAVVLDAGSAADCRVACLVSRNPYADYARIATVLHPAPAAAPGVHASAVVDPGARVAASAGIAATAVIAAGASIGERAFIGPGCVVGSGAVVGDDSRLVARVTVYPKVRIGRRCIVHAGAVLGADGFGFAPDGGEWVRVPQVGSVIIGDDVDIGANATIDRGAIDDTVIEDGVRIDNLVMIAHNVRVGAHTVIAALSGVSGSTRIGHHCMIAGNVGFAGHIEVGDRIVITGQTSVTRSLQGPGMYSSTMPAMDAPRWRRLVARLRHLDALFDRVGRLEGDGDGRGTAGDQHP